MAATTIDPSKLTRRKTIPYDFGPDHKRYIRACRDNTFNFLEGGVRAGKTIDNVFAFAHELKTTPDRIHLATGSTMANAKLNIGDANGFGLEYIFRGQCHWTKYKDNDALVICGPDTKYRERIVIFAGAGKQDSYKKIRGNSYGMWIATEINLHHENTIQEAFNRLLAAKKRKIFWDMNPEHPKAPIYTKYIDAYAERDKTGQLLGGYNYAHFNIYQNASLPPERIEEVVSQYEPGSIWYKRDIQGERCIAEGLVYDRLATAIETQKNNRYLITKQQAKTMNERGQLAEISIGVDFGGNGSGHAFVASAPIYGYKKLVALASRWYNADSTDPVELDQMFIDFVVYILDEYGSIANIYCDSAEPVLRQGLRSALIENNLGYIKIGNARKSKITDRIFALTTLAAQDRFLYTDDCQTLAEAISMAVWDSKKITLERLDDGTSDIDTMDAFEYSFEHDIRRYIKTKAS